MKTIILKLYAGDRTEEVVEAIRASGKVVFQEVEGGATSEITIGDVTIEDSEITVATGDTNVTVE
jgi:hypothetical protein